MDPALPEPVTLSLQSGVRIRALEALGVLLAVMVAGCSGGGREIYAGVRFFPRGDAEWPVGPVAYYEGVPLLISQNPDDPNWITMDRLLQIRDELGVRHRRDDVLSLVYVWDLPHDTIGSLRWERSDGRWRPSAVQRTVLETGGHAALLVQEEHYGTQVILTGYVIRCTTVEGVPACS